MGVDRRERDKEVFWGVGWEMKGVKLILLLIFYYENIVVLFDFVYLVDFV